MFILQQRRLYLYSRVLESYWEEKLGSSKVIPQSIRGSKEGCPIFHRATEQNLEVKT